MIHSSFELPDRKNLQIDEDVNGDIILVVMTYTIKGWKQSESITIPKHRRELISQHIYGTT